MTAREGIEIFTVACDKTTCDEECNHERRDQDHHGCKCEETCDEDHFYNKRRGQGRGIYGYSHDETCDKEHDHDHGYSHDETQDDSCES